MLAGGWEQRRPFEEATQTSDTFSGDSIGTVRAPKSVELAVLPGVRKALIIGVEKYCHLSPLPNAVSDAVRLKNALQQLGWSVTSELDQGKDSILEAIETFAQSVQAISHPCLFAFVGHGVELQGENFLLPADFRSRTHYLSEELLVKDLARKSISLGEVEDHFKAVRPSPTDSQATIFVLDCCRGGIEASIGENTRAIPVPVAAQASHNPPCLRNSCIVYSTTKGGHARDGSVGQGGPFMVAFAEEIMVPNARIDDIVMETRNRVSKHSIEKGQGQESQVVELVTKLTAKLFLNPTASFHSTAKNDDGSNAAAVDGRKGEVDVELKELLREFKIGSIASTLFSQGVNSVPHLATLLETTDSQSLADDFASHVGLNQFYQKRQLQKMLAKVEAGASLAYAEERESHVKAAGRAAEPQLTEQQPGTMHASPLVPCDWGVYQQSQQQGHQNRDDPRTVRARQMGERADVATLNELGLTALHHAAKGGDSSAVTVLLEAGADMEAKNEASRTAQHYAAESEREKVRRNAETVKMLLEAGADKEAEGNCGQTALHGAATNGRAEAVKVLLEAGADKEADEIIVIDEDNNFALQMATPLAHAHAIKALSEVGADKIDETALHRATLAGDAGAVTRLSEAGANTEVKDTVDLRTVLVQLMGQRADVATVDKLGLTALHHAAKCGLAGAVTVLLEAGADKEAKDEASRTALHHAAVEGHGGAVTVLLEAGADTEAKDAYGLTALKVARNQGHAGAIKVLEAGADKGATKKQKRARLHL